MSDILERFISAIARNDGMDNLARSLLSLMQEVTGFESVYLTTVDWNLRFQRILYAQNHLEWGIPEGLTVDWDDTLCKRALETGQSYTPDVAERWPDAHLALSLGITTYFSLPVYSGTDQVQGTLCAVDRRSMPLDPEQLRLLDMMAVLFTREWEHERLVLTLRKENLSLTEDARQDALTALSNRRALYADLGRTLANAQRYDMRVQLAFIDLDGFKKINDQHGHQAGDAFLQQVARRLREGLREGDFIGRYGGDEFVVFGLCQHQDAEQARVAWEHRLQTQLVGEYPLGAAVIQYAGASIGVVTAEPGEAAEGLLARADQSMYAIKTQRHGQRLLQE